MQRSQGLPEGESSLVLLAGRAWDKGEFIYRR